MAVRSPASAPNSSLTFLPAGTILNSLALIPFDGATVHMRKCTTKSTEKLNERRFPTGMNMTEERHAGRELSLPWIQGFAIAGVVLALGAVCLAARRPAAPPSRVFTETNSAAGNAILVFNRSTTDGSLTLAQTVPTRQFGSGSILREQGALLIASHFLLAVNAGSDSISVLNISGNSVHLIGSYPSNGSTPNSLTAYENTVYVLNSGGEGNISGFTLDTTSGSLTPIAGSTQPLSGASDPEPV
jgi:hypothetical protein